MTTPGRSQTCDACRDRADRSVGCTCGLLAAEHGPRCDAGDEQTPGRCVCPKVDHASPAPDAGRASVETLFCCFFLVFFGIVLPTFALLSQS
jgi:hypothetical protein